MLRTAFAAILATAAGAALAEEFAFVALGDMPYGEPAEVYPPFEALIDTVNAQTPDLVVHVGDTKSGSTPCSDQMLDEQLAYLDSFAAPVLYTPGDNEWTDCHREASGGFDPQDRLAYIRDRYFGDRTTTFGASTLPVETQAEAGYPENARLLHKGILFVTAHVVGSNNNFEIRDAAAVEEFMARDAANLAWLADSFAAAADADALVLAIHADMFEFDWNEFGDETWLRHSGFGNFGPALIEQAAGYGKPVLLIYGDSHVFRQMRPFPAGAPNLMSLEVPGAEDMHAVRVTADTAAAGTFSVELIRNPALSN